MKLTLLNRFSGDKLTTDRLNDYDNRIWSIVPKPEKPVLTALSVGDFIGTRKFYAQVQSVSYPDFAPVAMPKKRGKK